MNAHPSTDNPNYNPLRELTTLDYPPAAEVGRGRYKHLYSKGGIFGSSNPPRTKPSNRDHAVPHNSNGKGHHPHDRHFAPPMYGNPNGYARTANSYNTNAHYGGNAAYHADPTAPSPTPSYPQSYAHAHGGMPMESHEDKPHRGYPTPPLGPGGAPVTGYPPMYPPRGYHAHGPQHSKGGKGQPRILSRFKTRLCSFFMDSNGAFCPHGTSIDCQFAHGYEELRLPGVNGQPSTPLPPHILAELLRANAKNNGNNTGAQSASETNTHSPPHPIPPSDPSYAPNSPQAQGSQPSGNGQNAPYPPAPHSYPPNLNPPPSAWGVPNSYPPPPGAMAYPGNSYYPAAGSNFYSDPGPPCQLPTPPATGHHPNNSVGDPSSSNTSPVVTYNIPETYTAPPGPQSAIPALDGEQNASRAPQGVTKPTTPAPMDARSFSGSIHSTHSDESQFSCSLLSSNMPPSPHSNSTVSEVGSLGLPMPADAVNALAGDLANMNLGLSPRSVPKSGTSPLFLPENHNINAEDALTPLSLFHSGESPAPDHTEATSAEPAQSAPEVDLLAQKAKYASAHPDKEEENVVNDTLRGPML